MSNRSDRRRRRQQGAAELAGFDGFAPVAVVHQQSGFTTKVGVFAAGTVVAGAAAFGAGAFTPAHPAALFSQVQRDVVLAALGDGDSFVDAVQNVLADLHLGTIGQVFGLLGTDDDGNPLFNAHSPLYTAADPGTNTPEGGVLTDLLSVDGTPLTLDGLSTQLLGLSLSQPLWTDATDSSGAVIPSVLGAGSEIVMKNASGDLTPIGDLSLNQIANDILGGDVATATIKQLFHGLGLDGFAGFVTVICAPDVDTCTPNLIDASQGVGTLQTTDKVSELLASLMGVKNAQMTDSLGDYLETIKWGDSGGNLAEQSLGNLVNLNPTESLAQYLSDIKLGGGTILDPTPTFTLGSLDLGGLLDQFTLPGSDPVSDTMLTGQFLIDLGLFGTP